MLRAVFSETYSSLGHESYCGEVMFKKGGACGGAPSLRFQRDYSRPWNWVASGKECMHMLFPACWL